MMIFWQIWHSHQFLLRKKLAIAWYAKALAFRNNKSLRRVTEEGYSALQLREVRLLGRSLVLVSHDPTVYLIWLKTAVSAVKRQLSGWITFITQIDNDTFSCPKSLTCCLRTQERSLKSPQIAFKGQKHYRCDRADLRPSIIASQRSHN